MPNFFKKLSFLFKRPQVILITGRGRSWAFQTIRYLLRFYSEKKDVLVFESDLSKPGEIDEFSFYLKKSKSPVLIVTGAGKIPPDRFSFKGDKEELIEIKKIAKILPGGGFLILNFDDETVREIKNGTKADVLTYGFQEKADIKISDINIDREGTNFKINIEENIIPFWLKGLFGKEHIYSVMAAISLGEIKNMNLVNISQSFQDYKS
jgi:UDP-N-acetylmuramate-alanine ligase